MKSSVRVFIGARLFDGEALRDDCALVVEGDRVAAIVPVAERPRDSERIDLGGGVLSPGFVDWQVNGGGGVLFNATPTVEGIERIAAAHRSHGTTSLMPTVVTDAAQVLDAALAAAREANIRVPGAIGVHVEGPFIDVRRKGVHPEQFIRTMRDDDLRDLLANRCATMIVTLAPASASNAQIAELAAAGVIVSIGHSDATTEEAEAAFAAGARVVTHLYNAMSQLNSRAPGLVGAALADPNVFCGLIVDGHHVHAAAARAAVAAKGAGRVALVSDAMSPAAGGPSEFELQGQRVSMVGGRLVTADGVLAGAAITIRDAVEQCVVSLKLPLAQALRMATATPAQLLGLDRQIGRLAPGARADLVHLTDALDIAGVWIGGERV
jgi:N-acetylglucosamine-6-phosphate deacetylase